MFDSEFIKRLEYLSLLSKRVFKGQLLAQRRTKKTGGGIEFSDHRDYIHGDDLRYLDWNVYARHGDLLLKRFQEEEDLHVYLLLDASRSMNSAETESGGGLNKFDFARQLAASLAYIALADLDRVSVVAYDDRIQSTMPLVRGKDNVLTLLRFLESLEPSGKRTDFSAVVNDFSRRAPRTGLALVISDLYDHEGFRTGIDRLRYRQFEPHLIQVHTPAEANPDLLGDVELKDVETERLIKVTVTERKLKQYKQLFQEFVDGVDGYCQMYGLSYTRATTEVPFDEVLLKMMRTAGALG